MKYVKLIKDYSKNTFEEQFADYLTNSLDCSLCFEEIKNIKFKIQYLKPINDFIISSTAVTGQNYCDFSNSTSASRIS